ncbi:MAG TPA: hypothetical protein VGN49_07890, partial [Micrococcaceae bacterium]|nr:hypothetical protein [Micrococcaceae bacterium]
MSRPPAKDPATPDDGSKKPTGNASGPVSGPVSGGMAVPADRPIGVTVAALVVGLKRWRCSPSASGWAST